MWRSLGPHASTTGAASTPRTTRSAGRASPNHVGGEVFLADVAAAGLPSSADLAHRGKEDRSDGFVRPISPAARSGRLDGLPIEDEHGLHDVICEVVTGSGRAARAEEPHGLGGREAPRHEIAKVPQLFDLAFVVPAVAAAGPGGCREPVPALPGPDRRDGDPETLRHPRDGGFRPPGDPTFRSHAAMVPTRSRSHAARERVAWVRAPAAPLPSLWTERSPTRSSSPSASDARRGRRPRAPNAPATVARDRAPRRRRRGDRARGVPAAVVSPTGSRGPRTRSRP